MKQQSTGMHVMYGEVCILIMSLNMSVIHRTSLKMKLLVLRFVWRTSSDW